MKGNYKRIKLNSGLKKYDKLLADLIALDIHIPKNGWISTIRESLGMPLERLAERLSYNRTGVFHDIQAEKARTIQLKTLNKYAQALECNLFYALVPIESLADTLVKRAVFVIEKESKQRQSKVYNREKAINLFPWQIDRINKLILHKDPRLWSPQFTKEKTCSKKRISKLHKKAYQRNHQNLSRQALDEHLELLKDLDIKRPKSGWINALRRALAINYRILLSRTKHQDKRLVYDYRLEEVNQSITIDNLDRISNAMECILVYAFIPKTTLNHTLLKRAALIMARHYGTSGAVSYAIGQKPALRETVINKMQQLVDDRDKRLWNPKYSLKEAQAFKIALRPRLRNKSLIKY